ncbi:Probable multidrug resistance ABC transporter ATP-binding/permease protein YheI [Weeksella virosa]|uniref:ABC transporter ATP-binding protein n=1 Tax=Weeksella virosa TaxID=1014 RepID=UPI000E055314|nr:ABC transporter ATP-binding protein [Weeksella virosa]SUP53587.1 Probable multidrug resistance ABC transporter ATP-binding/permease protein YheI [Weeksella virosa]
MKALQKLNKFLWNYKWKLIIGFFLIICSNYVNVFSINYIGKALNSVQELLTNFIEKGNLDIETLKQGLLWTVLAFIGLKILAGILTIGTRQMIIATSRLIEYDLKNVIFQHYQNLSLTFYKKNKTGDLMNRITEDVSLVRQYLGPGIMYPIDLLSRTFILFFFMLQIDRDLTLYTLAPLPILSLLIYQVALRINKRSKILQAQQSLISSSVQDTFAGIRIIKSFNTENFIKKKYELSSDLYQDKALSLAQIQAAFGPLMIIIVGLSNLVILYLGGKKYMDGTLSIGVIGQFFMYLNMLIWPFTSLGWVTMIVQRAEASMARINEFLDQESEIVNHTQEPTPIKGEIEFRNVSYIYENTGIKALDSVSFKLKKGETIAIIGKTGSGKSTIALLIARLLQPTSGEILLDGKPLDSFNLYDLREAIGFVPQESFLFSDTIQNNILFGSDEQDQEKAIHYAKQAVVHDNIMGFKEAYQTVVGERGVTLSGGQKQRISIARALVKNPQILILDDALSAVDTETEEQILTNLETEIESKTAIIITHRISSAKNANEVLVLNDGQVEEFDTPSNLMKSDNYFSILYREQLKET